MLTYSRSGNNRCSGSYRHWNKTLCLLGWSSQDTYTRPTRLESRCYPQRCPFPLLLRRHRSSRARHHPSQRRNDQRHSHRHHTLAHHAMSTRSSPNRQGRSLQCAKQPSGSSSSCTEICQALPISQEQMPFDSHCPTAKVAQDKTSQQTPDAVNSSLFKQSLGAIPLKLLAR